MKRWSYDRTPLHLAISPAVSAAAVIGRLPDGKTVDDLDALLREIPMEVPEVDRGGNLSGRAGCGFARRCGACIDRDMLSAKMWTRWRRRCGSTSMDEQPLRRSRTIRLMSHLWPLLAIRTPSSPIQGIDTILDPGTFAPGLSDIISATTDTTSGAVLRGRFNICHEV
ncbi:hypothetical protein C8Q77DRAFT_522182 [Trametes polyzona]|nr:hypothetical protein C8Q77DRAFT_522182 [Trametes polyzona]